MNKHYRQVLYHDYARHFGSLKAAPPSVEQSVYRSTYSSLPRNRSLAIADVGCGQGQWLTWLHTLGFENLTGIEVSEAQAEIAARTPNVSILRGDALESLRSRPRSFDLIHAKDLIEHLDKSELIEFLQVCSDALKPGGRLWLLSFNAQAPLAATTRYGDFTHEGGLTPLSFAQILRATGFENITVKGVFNSSGSHVRRKFDGPLPNS